MPQSGAQSKKPRTGRGLRQLPFAYSQLEVNVLAVGVVSGEPVSAQYSHHQGILQGIFCISWLAYGIPTRGIASIGAVLQQIVNTPAEN